MAASSTLCLCLVALCFISSASAYGYGRNYRSNKTEDVISYLENNLVRGSRNVLAFTRSRPYSKSAISGAQQCYTQAAKEIDDLISRLKGTKVPEAEKTATEVWDMVTKATKVSKDTFMADLKKFGETVKKTQYTTTPESVRKVLEELRKKVEMIDCRRLVAYRILVDAHKQAPMTTAGCDTKAELLLTLRRLRPVTMALRDLAGKVKAVIPDFYRYPFRFHHFHYWY